MASFGIKKTLTSNSVSLVNVNLLRPEQKEFLHDNLFKALEASFFTNDTRILINQAPTGRGKSFVIVNVTIPSLIQQYPHTKHIVVTSPDMGCVDAPHQKFKELWHNKVITNRLGNKVRIRVLDRAGIKADIASEDDIVSAEPIVSVAFLSTQMVNMLWGQYTDPSVKPTDYTVAVPDFVLVDEIHYGMGTISWETIFADQGRNNKNFQPHWLPILVKLSTLGCKVIGYTGTPTKSQQGETDQGSKVFHRLEVMPKTKDNTAIVRGWYSATPEKILIDFSSYIEQELANVTKLMSDIDADTWSKASDFGISKIMPGMLYKYGQENATNGLPLKRLQNPKDSHEAKFKKWAKKIGADYGIVTSQNKEYQKTGNRVYSYPYCDSAVDVINRANHPSNYADPVCLAVIRSGNMGWDIPRLKYVVVLTHPSGKEVTLMQEQLMARGNRFTFPNMYSHSDMANKIASLDVTTEQKKLLAQYVIFMCTVEVSFSKESSLMNTAYNRFANNAYSLDEGTKVYMDAIDNFVPKNNVTKFSAPHFTTGYSAGSLNQQYKKYHCEACLAAGSVDSNTGKTICEIEGRKVREFERGSKFTEEEWKDTWFHTLALDHKDGDRTNYKPENLFTRCPTNNGIKTYDAKDYLGKYDSFGNKRSGT